MKIKNIVDGMSQKEFLYTEFCKGKYTVKVITVTDEELLNNELYDEFHIDTDMEYSLYTASAYVGERKVMDIEVGEILEIDGKEVTLMRLA